ncbi:hypothetical protein ACFRAM_27335 [Paenibacillus sp. NPDC056722]|uniref:hypothetical protein n=1 Tax=Paenibacillus sp. NPDC056722 TaxID=3345924 RepID=UPI00369F5BFD
MEPMGLLTPNKLLTTGLDRSPSGNRLTSAIGVQLIRRMSYVVRTTAALPAGIAGIGV